MVPKKPKSRGNVNGTEPSPAEKGRDGGPCSGVSITRGLLREVRGEGVSARHRKVKEEAGRTKNESLLGKRTPTKVLVALYRLKKKLEELKEGGKEKQAAR